MRVCLLSVCLPLFAVACDDGEGSEGTDDAGGQTLDGADDANDDVNDDGDGGPEPEVWCGDDQQCSEVLGTCCFKLDITVLDIVGRCVFEPGACAMDESYLSCDDRSDCPGTPCCMLTLTIDGNDRYMATCGEDPKGCGLTTELCQAASGPDTGCLDDRFCCHPPGDAFGTCVLDQATCDEMKREP